MRYLVYSNTGLTSKQIGLTAEIAEKLKKKKGLIRVVLCDNILENCFFNRSHNLLGCATCQARLTNVLKQAGIKPSETIRLKHKTEAYTFHIPFFKNLDELIDFNYDEINIGRGVASSIISYKRDYNINSEKYGRLIEIELKKSANVLLNFQEILAEFQPDEIYLFNGRFAEVFPVVELAKKLNIPFYTMESGAGNNYELFENHLPHSIEIREQNIKDYWESGDENLRTKKGRLWFENKRKGIETHEKSFTQKQKRNEVPKDFDDSRQNIAIFNSSEDELKAIMEWETPLYRHQNEALEQIFSYFNDTPDIHFYLRIHPNLGDIKNTQIEEIKQMKFHNLTIIPPDSPIDSYRLMDLCDKIITFGSSVGIEATYWGKPSILYGKAFYLNLDVAYVPKNFKELVHLIQQKDLLPKSQFNTLPYGYYMSEFGYLTKSFKYGGLKNSTFKNQKIRIFYRKSLLNLLRYLRRLPLWVRLHKIYYGESFNIKSLKKYK